VQHSIEAKSSKDPHTALFTQSMFIEFRNGSANAAMAIMRSDGRRLTGMQRREADRNTLEWFSWGLVFWVVGSFN
jgi:hypothetical protein